MSSSPLLWLSLALAEGSASATSSGSDSVVPDLELEGPVRGGDADHVDFILGLSSASFSGESALLALSSDIEV